VEPRAAKSSDQPGRLLGRASLHLFVGENFRLSNSSSKKIPE